MSENPWSFNTLMGRLRQAFSWEASPLSPAEDAYVHWLNTLYLKSPEEFTGEHLDVFADTIDSYSFHLGKDNNVFAVPGGLLARVAPAPVLQFFYNGSGPATVECARHGSIRVEKPGNTIIISERIIDGLVAKNPAAGYRLTEMAAEFAALRYCGEYTILRRHPIHV